MNPTFPISSFVKAKLLREPVYREDGELWEALRSQQDEIRHYFRQIGQELVLDEGDGFAFLRQLHVDGDDPVPRIVQRRALSYHATLLLVCLREALIRFDTSAEDSAKLVKTRTELVHFVSGFVPESNNEVRDVKGIESAITRLQELGFLRALDAERETFEVMRIVKARITPEELQDIKIRLQRHAESGR
jgi:hypothetical protein